MCNRGEWCNVVFFGFGFVFFININNIVVDVIVWIKFGGEFDGECGYFNVFCVGYWYDEFV